MKGIKLILFIAMLILTYIVSDKVVDYLLTIDVIILKRSLNIILATLLVFATSNKKQ